MILFQLERDDISRGMNTFSFLEIWDVEEG